MASIAALAASRVSCFSSSSSSPQLRRTNNTISNTISSPTCEYDCRRHPKQQQQQQHMPRLLLSSPTKPESRYLYDVTIQEEEFGMKLNSEIHLPEMAESVFIGSSQGFLISVDISPRNPTTIRAFNPLTGFHLPIPPFPPPIPPFFGRTKDKMTWKKIRVGHSFSNLYDSKAILSPSLDFIVVLPPDSNPFFAPLSCTDTPRRRRRRWTMFPLGFRPEGIFHKGSLYTINRDGDLSIYHLKASNTLVLHPLNFSLENTGIYKKRHLQSSLVESPDGKDLFMVFRGVDDDGDWDDPRALQTNSCQVFKLTFNREEEFYQWKEVKSIGDLAFFVGLRSSSLAVDLSDRNHFLTLKPNCVYFSDSWVSPDIDMEGHCTGDAGVCSLEDGRVHYIKLASDDGDDLNWPQPVWYSAETKSLLMKLQSLRSFNVFTASTGSIDFH